MTFQHYSVLLNETIEQLDIKEEWYLCGWYFRRGGHANACSAKVRRMAEDGSALIRMPQRFRQPVNGWHLSVTK